MEAAGNIAKRFSKFNRTRKFNDFMRLFRPDETTKILDVGPSNLEYQAATNTLEKLYPYQQNITALGLDPYIEFSKRYPEIEIVTYDGGTFPFGDNEFDICWCNAVLEHVGNRDKQRLFINEIHRVSRSAFVTTPNRYFPFETHTFTPFLHYLPKWLFDKYLKRTRYAWAAGDYMFLFGLHGLKKLLKSCDCNGYRILKNRLLLFTVDFVIVL